jgi:hypothetical protein
VAKINFLYNPLVEKRIYTPIEYIEGEIVKPVIFLAGPIQGAPDWQNQAGKVLIKYTRNIIIANPRRQYLPDEFDYGAQVDWETFHLRRAGENGVILFWLPRESHKISGRAYAQTSRIELGEWKVKHERDGIKLVVGIEHGFSGERYIARRFSQDCPEVPILNNLEQTCLAAIEMVKKK